MRRASTSFAIFAAATVLGVAGAVGINAYADPYDVFGRLPPSLEPANGRVHGALELSSKRPQQLFLGSSRAAVFGKPMRELDASSSTISLMGTTIYEERRFFEHALAVAPIKRATLLLDFVNFNVYQNATTMESVLAVAPDGSTSSALAGYLPALVSLDALKASFSVLRSRGDRAAAAERAPARRRYEVITCQLLRPGGSFRPNPLQRFALKDDKSGRTTVRELERILELAHAHDVELTVLISPTHAWLIQGVESLGLWQTLEDWKRALVGANERIARAAGREPFALWTFEDVAAMTTEEVPPGFSGQLRYFLEPSHFSPHVARYMLQRAYATNGAEAPGAFGEQLTSATIERSLGGTRERLRVWRDAHPEVLRFIAKAVRGECTF